MLRICECDLENNYRVLNHGKDVFHKALSFVVKGENRFRVINDEGENYDLVYVTNHDWAVNSGLYSDFQPYHDTPLYPPYFEYDEQDREKIVFDMFENYDTVWFEKAGEYSVVLARVLLEYTDIKIVFSDARAGWFLPSSDRISYGDRPEGCGCYPVLDEFVPSAFDGDFSRMDAMVLFHHVFFFQWITPLRLKDVRYVEIMLPKAEGIGSILLTYGRAVSFFGGMGFTVTIKPGTARYGDDLLKHYFNFAFTPKEADENNTIYVVNFYSVINTGLLRRKGLPDKSVFNEKFLNEMKEYADHVMTDKKMLGVLMRGSDYITSKMSGNSRAVSVDEALPSIRKWMENGYDRIFLATEDEDILNQMRSIFGEKILAVAQERYRVDDFRGMTTISEVDNTNYSGKEYQEHLEDVTVNYLYAMYCLSRCEDFIHSCNCGGVLMVKVFNENQFHRILCLSDNRELIKGRDY